MQLVASGRESATGTVKDVLTPAQYVAGLGQTVRNHGPGDFEAQETIKSLAARLFVNPIIAARRYGNIQGSVDTIERFKTS